MTTQFSPEDIQRELARRAATALWTRGNLTYKLAGRTFNPICAMASDLAIVQTQHIRELGEIHPDNIHTPGIFVDRVLHVPYGDPGGF